MTSKAEFNADEWSTIVEGPLYAAIRVIGAERGGTFRESLALGRVYQQAREHHGDSELLDELLKSPPAVEPDHLREAQGNPQSAVSDHLRAAMSVIEAKATPAEADSYKQFVMTVAQHVASAHKSGGFLGIGGKEVSDAENRALDEISVALGAPPAA